MQIVRRIATTIMGLGILFMINGCSTTLAVMGIDGESSGGKLRASKLNFSKEENIIMQKDKAYVVLVSDRRTTRNYLYEDIGGKIVLVANIGQSPGKAIVEVSEGKHVYVSSSDCGGHTMTIYAEKGKAYYMRDIAVKKLSVMDYCKGEAVFQAYNDAIANKSFGNYPNFSLNKESAVKAETLILNSSLPSKYEDHKKDMQKDKEDVHPALRVVFQDKFAAIIH